MNESTNKNEMVEEEKNRHTRPPSCIKNVTNYFREYCSSTSIHGFRYFGEQRTICEKLWWITCFGACLAALVISILAVYQKWNMSPVIVSFATKPVPIYHLPFPAITVCSESKLNASAVNFTEVLEKFNGGEMLTTKEVKIMNYITGVCDMEHLSQFETLDYEEFLDIVEEITPNYFPINCVFFGIKINCTKYFTPILTDEGLCYTFNILDRKEMFKENVVHYSNYQEINFSSANWSMESGYSPTAGLDTYPARALAPGGRYALSFDLLTVREEIVGECKDSVEGYKALLHAPIRVPLMSQQYFRIPYDQLVTAAISPAMINTSTTVKNYPPEKRECYFPSERNLKYYTTYSKMNCNYECNTNYTLEVCDCVHFSMPHENGTRVCGGSDLDCLRKVEYFIQIARLINNLASDDYSTEEKTLSKVINCNCLPLCTDIDYHVSISQTDWSWSREGQNSNNLSDSDYYMSRLTVFFLSGDFIPSERNELYGPLDFLANFGGLLGLFTGFSVLSLIEIIYFLSVRLMGNIRMYGHWWSESD